MEEKLEKGELDHLMLSRVQINQCPQVSYKNYYSRMAGAQSGSENRPSDYSWRPKCHDEQSLGAQ